MWAEVMKLRLDGRVLHKGWWGAQTLYRGNLVMRQSPDQHTHRYSMQAWLKSAPHQDPKELGVLFDAELLWIDGDAMCLTGYERDTFMNREVRQSWLVRAITLQQAQAAPERARGPAVAAHTVAPGTPSSDGDNRTTGPA
ncbi:hypothetical protein [Cupriavidus pampae]|uniref:Uncharacterized protein n=2 Tax=Cupriavidus pampae TaxID=659251 RepID=A0ABN7ZFT2_9BURK|nr:hypothetical protein [Cupriavidus pampae]CAG9184058.1 hypothetical protein LMG32289_05498 [Cupriavidus pampae]